MSKQDVIDYVMETPHNTNKAVLEGLVDTAIEESQVQADWNQNDPAASDYVKNRICYEEETVTELGNTYSVWNELTKADRYTPISYKMNGTIYKDVVPTYNSTAGAYMYNAVAPYDHYIGVLTENSFIDSGGVNFQFVKIENTVKQIDSKFIPTASPDWNQNDETAKDYIKNRICYEEIGVDKTYTLTPNRDNDTWNFTNGDIPLILGQSATVKSFGGISSTFVGTVTQDSDGKLCIDATSVIPITIYSNTATYNYSWIGNTGLDYVTVTISSTVVHQIDPKFIPIDSTPTEGSTNAASSDALAKLASNIDDINGFIDALPGFVVAVALDQSKIFTDNQKQIARNNIGAISSSELVQSDWNQNDPTASDYIKNKPTIDTALSSTSENAIQNKVVKAAIDNLALPSVTEADNGKILKVVNGVWTAVSET